MIEAGVDMWGGQPMNDKKMLCEKYGDKIILGVSPTNLTTESTDEEIRAAYEKYVEDFIDYRVYGGDAFMVPNARAVCYEYTRKAYCG